MANFVNRFATITTVLAAAVANAGTFTVPYPTGTTQATFTQGMAGTNSYMIVNGNDRYPAAASGAGTFAIAYGASNITITNNIATSYSLPAGASIQFQFELVDGNDVEILAFPITLASVAANGDVVTDFRPGFAGTIEDFSFVVGTPVTTASKLATLNLEIGTTDLTGGTIALTSALATPLGKIIPCAAITGNNIMTADSVISIEASGVTAFSEGTGTAYVRVRRAVANAY